jgi:hypothetical protein
MISTSKNGRLHKLDGYVYDSEERVISKEETSLPTEGFGDRPYKPSSAMSPKNMLPWKLNTSMTLTTESWLLENRKFFYYDQLSAVEPEVPAKADALFLYPNPSSGVVQIKLVGQVSIYVYSLSGQLVQKFHMAPSEKMLDLSHLPAGMYQVMAKSDEDYFSGKLILQ